MRNALPVTYLFSALALVGVANGEIVDSGAGFGSFLSTSAVSYFPANSDNPNPFIVLNSPLETHIASQTASIPQYNASGSATVSLYPSEGNMGLHGMASANAGAQYTSCTGSCGSQAMGEFDMYWYDQFNIGGSGLQTFAYTLTLDGNVSLTGAPTDAPGTDAFGELRLYANTSYQGFDNFELNPGCVSGPGAYCGLLNSTDVNTRVPMFNGSSVSGDLTLEGGSSIELGLYLTGSASALNLPANGPGNPNIQSLFDAEDTGFLTLTPVTAGASFTTASGLTYAASPEAVVPEPGAGTLVGIALAGFLAVRGLKVAAAVVRGTA